MNRRCPKAPEDTRHIHLRQLAGLNMRREQKSRDGPLHIHLRQRVEPHMRPEQKSHEGNHLREWGGPRRHLVQKSS